MPEYLIKEKFKQPVSPDEVRRDWRSRGFSCGEFSDPPGREWNDFVHNCNELLTVVKGKLELHMNDQIFHVSPGDEVFIPKGIVHSVRNIHNRTTYWLYGYD